MKGVLLVLVGFASGLIQYPDYKDHPCKRKCGQESKKCYYDFTADFFASMQPDCENCLNGVTADCFNPNCVVADGIQKGILTFNKKLPAPTIEVCLGDQIIVTVNNQYDNAITIHWHGQQQHNTSYMDGVPMITQCPITSFTKFRYHFTAQTIGTHFYHSHSAIQRMSGFFGALIVRQPDETNPHIRRYDFDLSEHIIQVTDWVQGSPEELLRKQFISKAGVTPISMILVNGWGSNATNNVPVPIFTVRQSYRYRFRLIHSGNIACPIKVQFQEHNMSLISTDGYDIEPVIVDTLHIADAERFDFIINADKPTGYYWIKFTGEISCNGKTALALLKYEPEDSVPPSKQNSSIALPENLALNCINAATNTSGCIFYPELKAILKMDARYRKTPDVKYWLGYDIYFYVNPVYAGYHGIGDKGVGQPAINNISFVFPNTNLLQSSKNQKFCNKFDRKVCPSNTTICQCLHVIEVKLGDLVEVILVDEGKIVNLVHPMHLHGHAFRVLAQDRLGKSTTIAAVMELDKNGGIRRNFEDPPVKDTVPAPSGGYTVIRFIADNPGFWFFHCHVEFHLHVGMALVWKVGKPQKPPRGFPKCGDYLDENK